jgi:AcrR family transcriptional regulator
MGTRERIIDAAIEAFNQYRATNVSTIQIADSIGISTGNLYYYFKNKEHIIRSIWDEQIRVKMDSVFYNPEAGRSESGILNLFSGIATYTYQYRFFYLEMYALLSNDPELQARYVQRALKLMERSRELIDSWIALGIMRPMPEEEKKILAENCWTLGQSWTIYSAIIRHKDSLANIIADETWHVYHILRPYFTDEANNRMGKLMDIDEKE